MTDLNIKLSEKLKKDGFSQRRYALKKGFSPENLNQILNGKTNLTMRIAAAIYEDYPDLADALLRNNEGRQCNLRRAA